MATVSHTFFPGDAQLPTSNPATPSVVFGTNFPVVGSTFDTTTQETEYFYFVALRYGSGNVTVTVLWYADTASSGTFTMGASLAAITPNTDTQDIETKAFATENTATDTHLGTTGQRLHSFDITVSNLDSLTANDWVVLRMRRDTGDTMAGDAIPVAYVLSYSDT